MQAMDQPTAHEHSTKTEAPSVEVTSGSVQYEASRVRRFALAVTAVFFVIALIGILSHEMWRDELHCWLIARDSHSFAQLYQNRSYDGHPVLWYALLYTLTWFTVNPVAMQILLLVLATASVYLFNRFSNFSVPQRVLFSFGYYSIYEYSMIARSYSLGFFLVILFCSLYGNRRRNAAWLFLVLILLANTSAFGLGLSVCLAGMLSFDWFSNRKKAEWKDVSFTFVSCWFAIFLLGAAFSVMQTLPKKDNTLLQPRLSLLADHGRMIVVLSKISEAYLLIPEIRSLPHWVSSQSDILVHNYIKLDILISIVLVTAATAILARRPLALLLYWTGTVVVICILGLTLTLGPRHIGHLVMILVAALWLADYFSERDFRSSVLIRLSQWGRRIQNGFVVLMFGLQTIAGVAIYVTDLEKPFSASKAAANFIKERGLSMLPIVGTPDWVAEDFAALLNKQIYYPERNEFGSFIIWDGKRKPTPTDQEIVQGIDTVLGQNQRQALLILNYRADQRITEGRTVLDFNTINPTIKLEPVAKFGNAMMFDEVYYIYLARRVKS